MCIGLYANSFTLLAHSVLTTPSEVGTIMISLPDKETEVRGGKELMQDSEAGKSWNSNPRFV